MKALWIFTLVLSLCGIAAGQDALPLTDGNEFTYVVDVVNKELVYKPLGDVDITSTYYATVRAAAKVYLTEQRFNDNQKKAIAALESLRETMFRNESPEAIPMVFRIFFSQYEMKLEEKGRFGCYLDRLITQAKTYVKPAPQQCGE